MPFLGVVAMLSLAAPAATSAQVDDPTAQARTIGRMRNLGTALMAWLTDAAQASDSSMGAIDVDTYRPISRRRLEQLLVPRYIDEIPEEDGWGNDFEVFVETDVDLMVKLDSIILIRSPGSDGRFDGSLYQPGALPELDYSRDIVWVDGRFVRAPAQWLPVWGARATGSVPGRVAKTDGEGRGVRAELAGRSRSRCRSPSIGSSPDRARSSHPS